MRSGSSSPRTKALRVDPAVPKRDDAFYYNCVRCLAIDTVQGAKSGHPGAPMGMAPIAHVLWGNFLNFDPTNPKWFNRDRFVLSNGHASALQYSMLHVCGYNLPMDQLKAFRQLHSKTPGHPEVGVTDGIEVTTGPLGQGIANAVGMAIAEAHLAARFNKPDATVVDHHTYVFLGDGCLMEGVGQEALSLAGSLRLEKLIVVYDNNYISIDGSTDIAFNEDPVAKYRAIGYHVIEVKEGNDNCDAMRQALHEAKAVRGKPKMVVLTTTIGFGSKLENTAKVHGSPLGDEDIANVKAKFGRDKTKKYDVDADVYAYYGAAGKRGGAQRQKWLEVLGAYKKKYPADGELLEKLMKNDFSIDEAKLKTLLPKSGDDKIATRKASENSLGVLLNNIPGLVGGSADLTGSNLTRPADAKMEDFQPRTPWGRYFRFGVREHCMGAVMNGMVAHGGLIPYGGTFFNFVGYAQGALRLAALSKLGVIWVATHDGVGLGEDGPTHQPTELSAYCRALSNCMLLRPADQTETSGAWLYAVKHRDTPTVMALSRQGTKPLKTTSIDGTLKGGYTVCDAASPDVVIIGTGSELGLCVDAAEALKGKSVTARVVSMPCVELFQQQSEQYRNSILRGAGGKVVPVISCECWTSFGWSAISHAHHGIDGFGESAPEKDLNTHFGLTSSALADKCVKLVTKCKGINPLPAPGFLL